LAGEFFSNVFPFGARTIYPPPTGLAKKRAAAGFLKSDRYAREAQSRRKPNTGSRWQGYFDIFFFFDFFVAMAHFLLVIARVFPNTSPPYRVR
jgi:hypothetical protein